MARDHDAGGDPESRPPGAPMGEGRGSRSFAIGAALMVAGLACLAALQYVTPATPVLRGLFDHAGMVQHSEWLLGRTLEPWDLEAYLWTFRALVLLVWIGYGALVRGMLRTGWVPVRWGLAIGCSVAIGLAFLLPSSLTHDPYAYLAFGRMGAFHGWNPYAHTLSELAALGDPAAAHYDVAVPTVYGPVWTLLVTGAASALGSLSLQAQVVAIRLVQVLALVGAAFAARACCRVLDPSRADLALVAVMLNPVLLFEGPGNGHNDVLMMALLLIALALVLRSSWLAWPVLGLSIGIKFVTAAILPWLLFEYFRRELRGRAAIGTAARLTCAVALAAAPVAVAAVPYLTGADALAGAGAVWSAGAADGGRAMGPGAIVLAVAYVALTVWVLRGRDETRAVPAWTVWSAGAALFGLPMIMPWYWAWPAAVSPVTWEGSQRRLTVAVGVGGLAMMLGYTLLRAAP